MFPSSPKQTFFIFDTHDVLCIGVFSAERKDDQIADPYDSRFNFDFNFDIDFDFNFDFDFDFDLDFDFNSISIANRLDRFKNIDMNQSFMNGLQLRNSLFPLNSLMDGTS